MAKTSSVTNQTLDRGLSALTLIATAAVPPTIAELADQLGVHRSMAYRIVRTLESHGLTQRDGAGCCNPGHGLADLSRSVERSIREITRTELERLAEALGLTAFVAIPSDGDALTIDSAEPTNTNSVVSYRPGTRHKLELGAPGLAILAGRRPRPNERPEVVEARARGWAQSTGEIVAGLGSLATWVSGPNESPVAALAVLFPGNIPNNSIEIVTELQRSSARVSSTLNE